MFARTLITLALFALGILASGAIEAQTPPYYVVRGIHPPVPAPFETVSLRFSQKDCSSFPREFRVEYVAGEIRVRLERVTGAICGLATTNYWHSEVRLGAFPSGTYTVDVADATGAAVPHFAPQRLTFQVVAPPVEPASSPTAPFMDFSGHWWNPGESGWGMTITQSASGQMFVVFFVYDSSGAPTWYVAPGGTWENPVSWRATLYRTSGPPLATFLDRTFNPDNVVRTPVGSLWLYLDSGPTAFESPDFERASASWLIDGSSTNRLIRRMRF